MEFRILILLFINVAPIFPLKNGSLTFVIDDTASMYHDIASVVSGSKSIMDVIFSSGSSQIQDMVLVTFNDPGYQLRVHSSDRKEIEDKLHSIRVHGGDDCPEMSMSGLELGLLQSLPGSYVYLFTDDVPKDGNARRIESIKKLSHEKDSHVIFILTPNPYCGSPNRKGFGIYYDIAKSTAGQVFQLDKIDVTKIIPYINMTVNGEGTTIKTDVVPPGKWTDIPFEIDDQTEYAIASTSGNNVQFYLCDENGFVINKSEPIVWIENVKVMKIRDPGRYIARVYSFTSASIVIFGRTDFTFSPGFSILPIKSFEETIIQPYAGINTNLWISVREPKHLIEINSAELYDMNEKLLAELPLKQIYPDVYSTNKFLIPDTMFKIAVKGKVKGTGKEMKRFAKLPVEPIKLPGVPTILTPDTNYTGVVGDKVIRLPCLAIADPKPSVRWFLNGEEIKTGDEYNIEDGTLIIKKILLQSSKAYICRAINSNGSAEKKIPVEIKNTVDNVGGKQVFILEKTNSSLNCPLSYSENDSVRWYKNGYLDSDGPVKYLVRVSSFDDGNYTCRVSNDLGSENGETIEVIVDSPPKKDHEKSSQIIKWNGENLPINCGDFINKQDLQVEWLLNGVKLPEAENSLEIYVSTWGNYTCRVSNHFGKAEYFILVESDDCLINMKSTVSPDLPLLLTKSMSLPTFHTNEQFMIVPSGTELKMFCDSFKKFTNSKEIAVTCLKQDQYTANGEVHQLADLFCNSELEPQSNTTEEICAGINTKLINIGFKLQNFFEVFTTCYDTLNKVPVYTSTYIPNPKYKKYKDDELQTKKYTYGRSIKKQYRFQAPDSNCYYINGQLTNTKDIAFGVAQTATSVMSEYNDVLYLSCKNESHWEQLEEQIRSYIAGNRDYPAFTIWSGSSNWEPVKEWRVPRYLWKVIKSTGSSDSLAVIVVNNPHPEDKDVLCGGTHVCQDSWLELSGLPTYCCDVSDFSKAFNISETVLSSAV